MSSEHTTSRTLLERVRSNDQDAWRRLVHLYGPLVLHWCGHCGVRGPDADDVQQEVFQAVAMHLQEFQHGRPGDTFRGWLRVIARHKIVDHVRRQARHPEAQGGTSAVRRLEQFAEPALPEDSPKELGGLYHRALDLVRDEFEERTWQAFWRVAVDGQSPMLIAAELGVTPAAVRKAKSRVLLRLREEVGELIA